MSSIFLKDENLDKSPAIVGLKVMKFICKSGKKRTSIFDVVDNFKKEIWFSNNSFVFGLLFLYSAGLIEFDEPYLVSIDEN